MIAERQIPVFRADGDERQGFCGLGRVGRRQGMPILEVRSWNFGRRIQEHASITSNDGVIIIGSDLTSCEQSH
jgi:hypothetical protein